MSNNKSTKICTDYTIAIGQKLCFRVQMVKNVEYTFDFFFNAQLAT